ncbi:hypothetical protein OAO87_02105 [bacterium]|nr:hypothetical protein [bacterium]
MASSSFMPDGPVAHGAATKRQCCGAMRRGTEMAERQLEQSRTRMPEFSWLKLKGIQDDGAAARSGSRAVGDAGASRARSSGDSKVLRVPRAPIKAVVDAGHGRFSATQRAAWEKPWRVVEDMDDIPTASSSSARYAATQPARTHHTHAHTRTRRACPHPHVRRVHARGDARTRSMPMRGRHMRKGHLRGGVSVVAAATLAGSRARSAGHVPANRRRSGNLAACSLSADGVHNPMRQGALIADDCAYDVGAALDAVRVLLDEEPPKGRECHLPIFSVASDANARAHEHAHGHADAHAPLSPRSERASTALCKARIADSRSSSDADRARARALLYRACHELGKRMRKRRERLHQEQQWQEVVAAASEQAATESAAATVAGARPPPVAAQARAHDGKLHYDEALLREAYEGRKVLLGASHIQTLESQLQLAVALGSESRTESHAASSGEAPHAMAEAILRQVLAHQKTAVGTSAYEAERFFEDASMHLASV